jgi:hypothetical protein
MGYGANQGYKRSLQNRLICSISTLHWSGVVMSNAHQIIARNITVKTILPLRVIISLPPVLALLTSKLLLFQTLLSQGLQVLQGFQLRGIGIHFPFFVRHMEVRLGGLCFHCG